MGAVYRAIDRETGQEVAVKRLLDVRHAARFEIEARLLASLSHPRVVKVRDHSSDEQGLYIVMDLVHGIDLGAILKRSGNPGLAIGDAIEYARHGCEALQYVHGQQIVHRDVKPQNMILSDDGVILVDFGVARMLGGEEDQGTIAVGTPRFMAPGGVRGRHGVGRKRHLQPRRDDVDAADRLAAALRRRAQARPDRPRPAARAQDGAGGRAGDAARAADLVGRLLRRGDRRAADRRPRPVAGPEPRPRDDAPARHGGDRAHRGRHVRGRRVLDRADRPQVRRAGLRGGVGRRRLRGDRHAAAAGRRHRGRGRRQWRGRVRAGVPQGPALRPPGRRGHGLRAVHDGRGAAGARAARRSACCPCSTAATAAPTCART